MEVNVYDLLDIYENQVSKNTRNKRKINNFERNKMENIYDIKRIIESGNYTVSKYNIFNISRPKYRIVMSLNIKDKIINHYYARNILIKKLDKYLDMRNCATRKNMGYDYGVQLLIKYLSEYSKYDKFYILRIDISKYFYTIDHEVLKSLLIDKLDDNEYKVMCNIIDSTNEEYINKKVLEIKERLLETDRRRRKEIEKIPLYEKGKGLGIGSMTSQFLSIFYLYKLDHYIVHDLKLKHMVRYMDDYVIISEEKEKLKKAMNDIIQKLEKEYKLKINEKKTFIVDSQNGFDFLGYRYRFPNRRLTIDVKSENYKRRKENIKLVNYLFKNNYITYKRYFNSMSNYMNSYKYVRK